jgi:hypothetical protein
MRLSEDARKLVAFLGFRTMGAGGVSVLKFGGTGFLVTHPVTPDLDRLRITYLVTARHVAETFAGPFVIGVNDALGHPHLIDIDEARWVYHEDPLVDIAVVNIDEVLPHEAWVVYPSEHFVQRNALFSRFGAGDLVYIVGLHRLFHGETKILPIVHTRHIAMTPDEEIPIINSNTGVVSGTRGYLIEAQTLNGLSGSPVFVRYTNVTGMITSDGRVAAYTHDVNLLGVWQGAWDRIAGDVLTEELHRDALVPVGMGIIVPAERIIQTLNSPSLERDRAEWLRLHREANAATMD